MEHAHLQSLKHHILAILLWKFPPFWFSRCLLITLKKILISLVFSTYILQGIPAKIWKIFSISLFILLPFCIQNVSVDISTLECGFDMWIWLSSYSLRWLVIHLCYKRTLLRDFLMNAFYSYVFLRLLILIPFFSFLSLIFFSLLKKRIINYVQKNECMHFV